MGERPGYPLCASDSARAAGGPPRTAPVAGNIHAVWRFVNIVPLFTTVFVILWRMSQEWRNVIFVTITKSLFEQGGCTIDSTNPSPPVSPPIRPDKSGLSRVFRPLPCQGRGGREVNLGGTSPIDPESDERNIIGPDPRPRCSIGAGAGALPPLDSPQGEAARQAGRYPLAAVVVDGEEGGCGGPVRRAWSLTAGGALITLLHHEEEI